MGMTQSTTGGGAATQTGNQFQDWLQQQIGGASSASTRQSDYNNYANSLKTSGMPVGVQQTMLQQWEAQHPASSGSGGDFSNSPFGKAFSTALGGGTPDPSGASSAIAKSIANYQNYSSPYQSQSFSNPTLSNLPTDLFKGQTGMADLSGVPGTSTADFNTQQSLNPVSSQYTNALNQYLGGTGSQVQQANAGNASIGAGINLDPATQFDMNNPYFAALKQQQDTSLKAALADNNARFGAAGAGAIGTGAQYANSNLQAQAGAQDTISLQQALQGLQQQDLAERSAKANTALGSRGQDANVAIANAGNQTQASLANANNSNSNIANILQALTTARGQDFTSQGLGNSQLIDQLKLGSDQSQFNALQQNNRNATDIDSLLRNQLQGNNFGVSAAAQNSNNQQDNNNNQLNLAQLLNNFNLQNAGNQANFQGQTNALNQNGWLQTLGMGQGQNSMANSNIQQLLAQLFGGGQQATSIGTPQATSTYTPSPWTQVAQTGLGALGSFFHR